MNKYKVTVDVTMSCDVEVLAESEEEAKSRTEKSVSTNPWFYAKQADSCLSHEIYNVELIKENL